MKVATRGEEPDLACFGERGVEGLNAASRRLRSTGRVAEVGRIRTVPLATPAAEEPTKLAERGRAAGTAQGTGTVRRLHDREE
jgi:hypothetical protein